MACSDTVAAELMLGATAALLGGEPVIGCATKLACPAFDLLLRVILAKRRQAGVADIALLQIRRSV